MFWFSYNLLFHLIYPLLLPKFLWRMLRRGGYRKGFGQRVFRLLENDLRQVSDGRKLWVHAVSVGEVSVGLAFMDRWRAAHPDTSFLLTVNTSTGQRVAESRLGERDILLYPPVDSPWVINRLLLTVDVEALVLVETELWPNLLRGLHRRGVPVMLLNGRMSDRSTARLSRVPAYTRRLYPLVDRFAMQSQMDADRVISLGAPAERVQVVHSAKYDVAVPDPEGARLRRERLQASGFLSDDSRVLLGSSTWPGEERTLAEIYLRLREREPTLRLILVPRHAERKAEVLRDLEECGVNTACWTEGPAAGDEILLVDTTGELRHFTGLADWVFVGKSLFREEGQNPLEAAQAGKWILTGPGMNNFRQIMQDLEAARAVTRVASAEELEQALTGALDEPESAPERGARAAMLVSERQGSLSKSVEILDQLLEN